MSLGREVFGGKGFVYSQDTNPLVRFGAIMDWAGDGGIQMCSFGV